MPEFCTESVGPLCDVQNQSPVAARVWQRSGSISTLQNSINAERHEVLQRRAEIGRAKRA